MIIRYGKGGRILSCLRDEQADAPDGDTPKGVKTLRVGDGDLPDDLFRTFALGKYKVSRKKIVERPDWSPPEPREPGMSDTPVEELIEELTGESSG